MSAVGRTMITVGTLLLLFVAYQLWGTGIRTAQSQDRLEDDFARRLDAAAAAANPTSASTTSSTSSTSSTTDTTATTATTLDPASTTTSRLPPVTAPPLAPELFPARGEVAGHISIERIGVDWYFVEGVSVSDLKQGPGHYPSSPLPGQPGNAAIAGHRTTYGAPFSDVDQLQPGDEIDVLTIQGEFTYEVRAIEIVSPSDVHVLAADHWDFDGDGEPEANVLTLTSCHPRYSARQRIIVGAELVGQPAPPTPRPATDDVDDGTTIPGDDEPTEPEAPLAFEGDGLSGERAPAAPAIGWALLCAAIWLGAWAVGRRRPRLRWPAYVVGVLPFLVALFFFFEEFSRLLPANY